MNDWALKTLVEIVDVGDAIVVDVIVVNVIVVDVIVGDAIVVAVADTLVVMADDVVVVVFGKNDPDFHGIPESVHADAEAVDSSNDMVCDSRCCNCSGPHYRCNCSGLFSVAFAEYVYWD